MADPSIHEDQGKARLLGRRYAQLGPVVAGFNAWKSANDDLAAAREMAATTVFLESYFLPKRSSNFATRPPVSRMRCLPV